MIAACPKCSARYRVDSEKIGAEGARLRCVKCEAVFRVRVPAAAPEQAAAPQPVAQVPEPTAPAGPPAAPGPAAAPPESAAAAVPPLPVGPPAVAAQAPAPDSGDPEASPEPRVDRSRAIIIADPDVESGKVTAAAVATWGLQPILVHDGVEAMMTIQRSQPRVVVLDAALPKMYGFQICEVMKRNESLRDIRVILVGSIHHESRYRRPPTDLYGADLYLEAPDLPDGLRPLLEQSGLRMQPGGASPSTPGAEASVAEPTPVVPAPAADVAPIAPEPAAPPTPEPVAVPQPAAVAAPAPIATPQAAAATPEPAAAPAPAAVAAEPPAANEEQAKAERLARIIVSDIVLYQPEKFDEAVRAGNVAAAMESSLEEGRRLMQQRLDPSVLAERDYLALELERVAEERRGA